MYLASNIACTQLLVMAWDVTAYSSYLTWLQFWQHHVSVSMCSLRYIKYQPVKITIIGAFTWLKNKNSQIWWQKIEVCLVCLFFLNALVNLILGILACQVGTVGTSCVRSYWCIANSHLQLMMSVRVVASTYVQKLIPQSSLGGHSVYWIVVHSQHMLLHHV